MEKQYLYAKIVTPKSLGNYKTASITGCFATLRGANQSNKKGRIVPFSEAETIVAAHNLRVK